MGEKRYIMAFDSGTTSVRTVIFDRMANIVGFSQKEITQIYKNAGWVEHDPFEILTKQIEAAKEALLSANIDVSQIAAIGITNQRETTILWSKKTGKPYYNAIVWQCKRTDEMCKMWKDCGYNDIVHQKTGLVIDPYFSASKIRWLIDNIDGLEDEIKKGNALFGTVDTWLLWNLTGGKVHATDYSNASRTMLFNIHNLCWDEELMRMFKIPQSIMPKAMPSSYIFGQTDENIFGAKLPISGIAGDQQAALFGQVCFEKGHAKATYGTGCFLLINTGSKPVLVNDGILTTVAWQIGDKVEYALEGSIFIAGAVIQWLKDELGIIENASLSEEMAWKVENNNNVYFVPAFVGLGAPYWDMYARGAIFGLTRDTKKEHIVRAALESIAYQTYDVVKAIEEKSGVSLKVLKVDGGASRNSFIMQFLSDILGIEIIRPKVIETTSLGAAFLAGLSVEFWKDRKEIQEIWQKEKIFLPSISSNQKNALISSWHKAVNRVKGWEME